MDKTNDEYYISKAIDVAKQSTCLRNNVGAIIVKKNQIISTGFNGAPKYQKNCIDISNCYRNDHCIKSTTELDRCRAVGSHAESNAICLASKKGISTFQTEIYVVGHDIICNHCKAIIANSGIKRAVLQKQNGDFEEYFPEKDWNIHPIDL